MTTPAGWFPDPASSVLQQRYWDGKSWTNDTRPFAQPVAPSYGAPPGNVVPQASPSALAPSSRGLMVLGGVLLPILALLGLALMLSDSPANKERGKLLVISGVVSFIIVFSIVFLSATLVSFSPA